MQDLVQEMRVKPQHLKCTIKRHGKSTREPPPKTMTIETAKADIVMSHVNQLRTDGDAPADMHQNTTMKEMNISSDDSASGPNASPILLNQSVDGDNQRRTTQAQEKVSFGAETFDNEFTREGPG